MAVQIVDIIRFALPDPKHFIYRALDSGFSQRDRRELLSQIIAVDDAKSLDGIRIGTILPFRTNFFSFGADTVIENVPAHINKNIICQTHIAVSLLQKTVTD
jgi:hypothetical protein